MDSVGRVEAADDVRVVVILRCHDRPSSRSKLPNRRSSFALNNADFMIFRLGVRANSSTNST